MNDDKQIKPSEPQYKIVGKSKAVEHLRKQISKLAKSDRDVIIVGEAGVGKGAIARNIHQISQGQEKAKPFAFVNLSVLDDKELEARFLGGGQLVESTGFPSHQNLLESVRGGTLLIEEIEEASLVNQMKILSFLDKRQIEDFRLIITMKQNPKVLLEMRRLLEDLWDRIHNFEILEVPPLRERPEDIPLIVKHFTKEICKELGIAELVIDINAMDVLVRQPWKENIRELRAVIDKSILFSTSGRFTLPPELIDEKTEVMRMISNLESGQEFVLDHSLDVIERGIIERALQKFGYNQSRTSNFLGMTEQTLRYKLKRLNIESSRARLYRRGN